MDRQSEASKKAIDSNYKWIVLDKVVYRIRIDHYADLISTRQCKLKGCKCFDSVIRLIKEDYKPYTKPYQNFTTPTIKEDDTKLLQF